MKILRVLLPVVLLLAISTGSALAQNQRIATVDLEKLFKNYWKTKTAQAAINDHKAELDKEYRGMTDDLKKGSDDYQKLLTDSNDMAVSADERNRRKQAATDKLKQLQDSKAAIEQFERQAQATLGDQLQRMRENIIKELKAAVAAKAKASGFTLVLDAASETVNATPTVVYSSGDNDLTDVVLQQLNASAPINMNTPALTTPSLMRTNFR